MKLGNRNKAEIFQLLWTNFKKNPLKIHLFRSTEGKQLYYVIFSFGKTIRFCSLKSVLFLNINYPWKCYALCISSTVNIKFDDVTHLLFIILYTLLWDKLYVWRLVVLSFCQTKSRRSDTRIFYLVAERWTPHNCSSESNKVKTKRIRIFTVVSMIKNMVWKGTR